MASVFSKIHRFVMMQQIYLAENIPKIIILRKYLNQRGRENLNLKKDI